MSKHIDPVILLVDDNSQNLQVLGSMLKENGYKPLATKSGNEALSFMQSTQPDLILLDIMMPVMNGIEVCNHLKANDKTKDIP
ncbi:MAG: response regulator, partial [Calditrichia bacterium]|nr:response regulator [Calditrichia bacterium]